MIHQTQSRFALKRATLDVGFRYGEVGEVGVIFFLWDAGVTNPFRFAARRSERHRENNYWYGAGDGSQHDWCVAMLREYGRTFRRRPLAA
jgi:hypothetical protein